MIESKATVCAWCGEKHHMHSLCKPEEEDPDEWEVSEEPSEDDEDDEDE